MTGELLTEKRPARQLDEIFDRLRGQDRNAYENNLLRVLVTLLVLIMVKNDALLPIICSNGNHSKSVLLGGILLYHLFAQVCFLLLVIQATQSVRSQARLVGIDVAAACFLIIGCQTLAIVLAPWLAWLCYSIAPAAETAKAGLRRGLYSGHPVALAVHDLKAPLGGILASVEELRRSGASPEQKQLLTFLNSSSKILEMQANQLLDLSILKSEKLMLQAEDCDLSKFFKEIGDVAACLAREKHLAFHLEMDQAVPDRWYGDAARLNRVLLNLLSNAIKFTERGFVKLVVGVRESGKGHSKGDDRLRIAVIDSGLGLSRTAQEKIFLPYHQAREHHHLHHLGNGLGLAICAEIVKAMGGTIKIDSEPWQGSTFVVELPFSERPPDEPKPQVVERQSPTCFEPQEATVRILAVDDDPFARRAYHLIARDKGVTVELAASGSDALRRFRRNRHAIVALDRHLPDLSLEDLLAEFAGATPQPYIIVITGDDTLPKPWRLSHPEVREVLSKPFSPARLTAALDRAIGQSRITTGRLSQETAAGVSLTI